MKIGANEMIARRFRGGIGRIRGVRRGFRESGVARAEGTVNLIGGDMVKTRLFDGNGLIDQPGLTSSIEQRKRSDNIGLDKLRGTVNGAVDMRFRGKMDDRVDLVFAQDAIHQFTITDISFDKAGGGLEPANSADSPGWRHR